VSSGDALASIDEKLDFTVHLLFKSCSNFWQPH
jgi:hypothetical protein